MDIYIYGAGEKGREIYDTINLYPSAGIRLISYIDKEKEGFLNGLPVKRIERCSNDDFRIIVAVYSFAVVKEICLDLKKKGFNDIWWYKERRMVFGQDFFFEQCTNCISWQDNMIENMEMHVMDACNLNCKGCAHFSPIFKRGIPELKSRLEDVKLFLNKGIYPVKFNLLGGEPFLNPEIGEYARELRHMIPFCEIYIVTNGLLVPKTDDHVFQLIREARVKLSISEYEPTHRIIKEICDKLEKNKIVYEIRPCGTKEKFNKPLSIAEADEDNRLCISNGCITIWNGKISRCPTLMYIDTFNEYFKTKLPNAGIISLQSCPEGDALLEILKRDVPLCKHCIKNEIEWGICGKDVRLSDFAS